MSNTFHSRAYVCSSFACLIILYKLDLTTKYVNELQNKLIMQYAYDSRKPSSFQNVNIFPILRLAAPYGSLYPSVPLFLSNSSTCYEQKQNESKLEKPIKSSISKA